MLSISLPFSECQIIGIIWYVSFSYRLLSFSNMHFSFFHIFMWFNCSFPFITEKCFILRMCHNLDPFAYCVFWIKALFQINVLQMFSLLHTHYPGPGMEPATKNISLTDNWTKDSGVQAKESHGPGLIFSKSSLIGVCHRAEVLKFDSIQVIIAFFHRSC